MARTVTISIPSGRADALLGDVQALDGLLTVHRQHGSSVQPPGDVVAVEVTNRAMPALQRLLAMHGAGTDPAVSVTTSEPTGMMSASGSEALARDVSTSSLEETEFTLARETTLGINETIVMALAGAVAAVGLVTNAPHLVIGAMVIAPGFEPMLKVSLSVAAGGGAWRQGFLQTVKGYGALIAGALVAAIVLRATGTALRAGSGGYLDEGILVSYWSSLTAAGTAVTLAASLAGALLVLANRAVLTAGVMIALALVPGATLVGLGIASGDLALARDGALRWVHDAAAVTIVGMATFGVVTAKRRRRLHDS